MGARSLVVVSLVVTWAVLSSACAIATQADAGAAMDVAGDVTTFDADEVIDVASFDGTVADTPVDAGMDALAEAPSTLPCVSLPTSMSTEHTGVLDVTWARPTGAACPSALAPAATPAGALRFCNETGRAVGLTLVAPPSSAFVAGGLEDPLIAVYRGSSLPADFADCIALNDDEDPSAGPGALVRVTVEPGGSVVALVGEASERDAEAFYVFFSGS